MSQVKNIKHKIGDFEIEVNQWEISDVGITALWGPSGSGKTSLFRILIGLEPCKGYHWYFGKTDLAQVPVPEKRLGVVFQSLELFPHLSGEGNILFAARARKIPEEKAHFELNRLTTLLHLEDCLKRRAEVLSGGEKQRVALARALIGQPRFLFLDEPFSALDDDLRSEARKLVQSTISELKIPTLLITHDRDDIKELAQEVVHIRKGRLVN